MKAYTMGPPSLENRPLCMQEHKHTSFHSAKAYLSDLIRRDIDGVLFHQPIDGPRGLGCEIECIVRERVLEGLQLRELNKTSERKQEK